MKIFTILMLCFFTVFFNSSCSRAPEKVLQENQKESKTSKDVDAPYQKELEEIKKGIKGDIKIKLKKDAKGGYSWEITGKDANEIIKANDILKKRLND
ncbi:MAG TPA: hypothetical protein PLW88_01905 [Syntrophorhabdaceae bacterium]|nr:hypothetical protein [Syntrophorhabdaceae bacterium]HPP06095.1 hypothetical protein [Syntrophorhabdaceae bacterium]